jgi:hypothetical protein
MAGLKAVALLPLFGAAAATGAGSGKAGAGAAERRPLPGREWPVLPRPCWPRFPAA